MDLKNKYAFTKTAYKDLIDILNYISITLSNYRAAEKLYKNILQKLDQLVYFSNMGETVNNTFFNNKNVKIIMINKFKLYYIFSEEEKEIIILRILYSKQILKFLEL